MFVFVSVTDPNSGYHVSAQIRNFDFQPTERHLFANHLHQKVKSTAVTTEAITTAIAF